MIGFRVKFKVNFKRLAKRVRRGSIKSMGQAGALVYKVARNSIRRRKGPSTPGTAPHTRTKSQEKKARRFGGLKDSLRFEVERRFFGGSVVIGPTPRLAGTSGQAHEFGGSYRGQRFEKRPFMGPALQRSLPKIPREWKNIVR